MWEHNFTLKLLEGKKILTSISPTDYFDTSFKLFYTENRQSGGQFGKNLVNANVQALVWDDVLRQNGITENNFRLQPQNFPTEGQ